MTEVERYASNQNYMVNVTEVRGTPLIVINAYESLLFLIGFYVVKWLAWILKPICRENKNGLPLIEARPIAWLNENFNFNTPTSQSSRSSHSTFELSDSDEETDIERPNGNTGQEGALESPIRDSDV